MTLDTPLNVRADLAVRGVRVPTPVRRPAGAGPSDDGHLVIDGRNATLPINPASPYSIDRGKIWLGEIDTGLTLDVVRRPRFYDLTTADGVRYEQIARLHGKDVLATTVVQTCIRYAEEQRCRFCTIEESLRSGSTIAAKTPAQLAEVARAAVDLDGITQMVMTTGTTAGPDRGARNLVRCVRAVLDAVPGLPIQVQTEPPADLSVISDLSAAGAVSIGIHVESLDDAVRRKWMPGKGSVPVAEYWAAWDYAVSVFGRNQVSTYLLVGLGEDTDQLVTWAARLIAHGVYPFVVPYRPVAGAMIKAPAPAPSVVRDISDKVARLLRDAGMLGADQKAGCAACGACGVLQAAGG
ncbi:MSMEG_0568 family radical SAM protein [Actinoplanes sp. NPDC089786]|uniref:MSMEG_0568 family radical SAM protein n=1 Tax=Actinoplanes sp. NPDC089786 TaxID=3155185 RepID=UPI003439305D